MKIARSDLKIPGVVSTEMLRAFCVYENLTRFIMPLCTAVPGRPDPDIPATKMTCIVDVSGIGVRQIWGLRGYIQDLSKIFAINYPEVLDKVFVRTPISFLNFKYVGTRPKRSAADLLCLAHWCTILLSHHLGLGEEVG